MAIQNGDIAAARRVVDSAEDATQRRIEAEREVGRLRDEVRSLRSEMSKGTLFVRQRTWTAEQVENLRTNWIARGVLLEEALDGFEFVEEIVSDLKPTAKNALLRIRQNIEEEVGKRR